MRIESCYTYIFGCRSGRMGLGIARSERAGHRKADAALMLMQLTVSAPVGTDAAPLYSAQGPRINGVYPVKCTVKRRYLG